jgi:hypothetical protein
MGRRSILPDYQVLNAEDSSSNFNSDPTECDSVDVFSYDITVDASVVGTMTVQYCNEKNEGDYDWKDLNFGETTTINGASETLYRFQIQPAFKRTRLKWVNNAGTGNISARIYGMVRGA